jgi:hypothetical protein
MGYFKATSLFIFNALILDTPDGHGFILVDNSFIKDTVLDALTNIQRTTAIGIRNNSIVDGCFIIGARKVFFVVKTDVR